MIGYLINIFLGIIYFIFGVIFIIKKQFKNIQKTNLFFMITIGLFYILNVVSSIEPVFGSNLKFVIPISNLSPFLFTITIIIIFLPYNFQQKFFKLFCLFFIPMFFAGLFTSFLALLTGQQVYFLFALADLIAHISFSLFCFFLIKTKQVTIDKQSFLYCCLFIFSFIVFIIIINLIWGTTWFGLNFYGNHNIYGLTIFENAFVSAFFYITILTVLLILGYIVQKNLQGKYNGGH